MERSRMEAYATGLAQKLVYGHAGIAYMRLETQCLVLEARRMHGWFQYTLL